MFAESLKLKTSSSEAGNNFRTFSPFSHLFAIKKNFRVFSCLSMFKKNKVSSEARNNFRVFRPSNKQTPKQAFSSLSSFSMFQNLSEATSDFVFFDVSKPTPTRFRAKQETIFAPFRPFRPFSQLKKKRFSCLSCFSMFKNLSEATSDFEFFDVKKNKVSSEARNNFRVFR